ncbi:MAG: hypothetical protein Q8K82_16160, partial [Gemmatimonadaceae bacterium]|nr:hypothetical protein [Gemmatimonadaceae bacterium]
GAEVFGGVMGGGGRGGGGGCELGPRGCSIGSFMSTEHFIDRSDIGQSPWAILRISVGILVVHGTGQQSPPFTDD